MCAFNSVGGVDTQTLVVKANTLLAILLDPQLLISKSQFLAIVMEEWRTFLQATKVGIMKIFNKYDENGDGVMTLNEFEVLIRDIEPEMSKVEAAKLFMRVFSWPFKL